VTTGIEPVRTSVTRVFFVTALFLFVCSQPAAAQAIGDTVWQDSNGDGVQAGTEPRASGVQVRLLNCNDAWIASRTTNANGKFLFDGLPVGSYRLRFIAPSGYQFTTPRAGSAGKDSDADPATGLTSCVSLAAGQTRRGIDAGLVAADTQPLNVLFIAIDDLRPEIGAYGVDAIRTPNLDALAREGTVFTRAYAQMSLCSPSRTSLMTGLRPDTAGVIDLQTHFRSTVPGVVTLPQYFMNRGYRAEGFCKVYHGGLNDAQSWSVPHVDLSGPTAPLGPDGKRLPYAAVNVADSQFGDHKCATAAIDAINNAAGQNQPSFIAVGFRKPHLAFLAPPAYYALYDPNTIPVAVNPFKAFDAPAVAFENRDELSNYSGIPPYPEPLGQALERNLKRGYYAATSFVDAQVGRVLAALEASGAVNDTIVVVFGDHGYHLGEQADWAKHTNFEVGTRVPLIIRVPGGTPAQVSSALVELVDLYPTVVELAGLPVPTPAQRGGYPLEGDSLVQFIDAPAAISRRGAFSQWLREGTQGDTVGYTIRTNRYRYTEWGSGASRELELYDHSVDPDETLNVVYRPEYATIRVTLQNALDAGGKVDLPPSLR
jgi:iduronate 2-sulfatase